VGIHPVASPITVAVVEDQPVTIEGIQSWIDRDPGRRVRIVASGGVIDEVLAGPGGDADVILLDLNLNGQMMTDRVSELTGAGRRVVVFSEHADPEIVLAVIDAGAEFVTKYEGRVHCVETIVAVATARPYVTPMAAGAILVDSRPQRPRLSEREQTALLLWFQSMSKASVASRMGIAETTVKQYIDRVRVKYAKLGRPAATKEALLARAIEDGLIRADEVGEYASRAAARGQGSSSTQR
jgi:two-component system, NarL family, nitrate/nitrite response regulator NarL